MRPIHRIFSASLAAASLALAAGAANAGAPAALNPVDYAWRLTADRARFDVEDAMLSGVRVVVAKITPSGTFEVPVQKGQVSGRLQQYVRGEIELLRSLNSAAPGRSMTYLVTYDQWSATYYAADASGLYADPFDYGGYVIMTEPKSGFMLTWRPETLIVLRQRDIPDVVAAAQFVASHRALLSRASTAGQMRAIKALASTGNRYLDISAADAVADLLGELSVSDMEWSMRKSDQVVSDTIDLRFEMKGKTITRVTAVPEPSPPVPHDPFPDKERHLGRILGHLITTSDPETQEAQIIAFLNDNFFIDASDLESRVIEQVIRQAKNRTGISGMIDGLKFVEKNGLFEVSGSSIDADRLLRQAESKP